MKATMLCEGFKRAEIRFRKTDHRGDLLIVASQAPDLAAVRTWAVYAARIPIYRLGMAIGIVSISDCRPFTRDLEGIARVPVQYPPGSTFNDWAWLTDPTRCRFIEPFPVRGRLGLFDVPDSLVHDAMRPVV